MYFHGIWPQHPGGRLGVDGAGLRDVVAVPPAVEPVTLAEAKKTASVPHDDDDADIAALIVMCREHLEKRIGKALITQTRTMYLAGFPAGDAIRVTYPPLQAILSVQYLDFDGTLVTLDPSGYFYSAGSTPGVFSLKFGRIWPFALDRGDAIQVSYRCGYGDAPADVPMGARWAIRSLVAANYMNRESHISQVGGLIQSTQLFDDLVGTLLDGSYR